VSAVGLSPLSPVTMPSARRLMLALPLMAMDWRHRHHAAAQPLQPRSGHGHASSDDGRVTMARCGDDGRVTIAKNMQGCDVRLYQGSGFGNQPCSRPGEDFGCYANEDTMWIRPPCGSIFRCNADHHDTGEDPARQRGALLRCGSRYFRPAPGQTRLNCSCAAAGAVTKHFFEQPELQKRGCEERAGVDPSGGVSARYRRLPQPAGANPAVRCCRNRGTNIDWNVTVSFKDHNFAAWPRACEALCEGDPTGRCRYFSHSFRSNHCVLCAACVPEILLGDDTYASFQRVTEDPTVLYTGVL